MADSAVMAFGCCNLEALVVVDLKIRQLAVAGMQVLVALVENEQIQA